MGQLKTGITNLYKVLNETGPKLESLKDAFTKSSDQVQELGKKCDQGYDVLYLYLTSKFKKAGTTPDAQNAKKLNEIMDNNIAATIKGINQWKQDLKAKINDLNAALKASQDPVVASLKEATAQVAQLTALAEKKKAKWLKSAKYKDKIKIYLSVLDGINSLIKKQTEIATRSPRSFKNDWVDKTFEISDNMTVADVKGRASMDLDSSLKTYNDNKVEADSYVRKLRDEYKGIPGQLATMKKWVDEADAMEAEGT